MVDYPPLLTPLDTRSKDLRRIVVRMLEGGKRGHVGSAFSLVEIIRVLFDDVLTYDPKNPMSPDRDRFILSKGHGCLALYSLLFDKGFITEGDILKFCHPDGILGGHPERGKVPGVEASTGSLGHGLSIGVGMAYFAKIERKKHRIFVICSDGESNEGSQWEAALGASKHKLSNLTVLVDYNKMQSYSSTYEVQDMEPFAEKWRAFGFEVRETDGHDVKELRKLLGAAPFNPEKPSLILCHTVKGKGISFCEQNPSWHHKNKVTEEEVTALLKGIEEYRAP